MFLGPPIRLRHGCFFVYHLPRDRDDVVFDELLADILDICEFASMNVPMEVIREALLKSEHTLFRIQFPNISCF